MFSDDDYLQNDDNFRSSCEFTVAYRNLLRSCDLATDLVRQDSSLDLPVKLL